MSRIRHGFSVKETRGRAMRRRVKNTGKSSGHFMILGVFLYVNNTVACVFWSEPNEFVMS